MINYSNYAGSGTWVISAGNEELIQMEKTENSVTTLYAKEFDFYNMEDCVVKINNSNEILLPAGVGFYDENIFSFQVITDGISFCYKMKY